MSKSANSYNFIYGLSLTHLPLAVDKMNIINT